MNRITLIKQLIEHTNARNYLEIGVKKGLTFMQINADTKWGVDPIWPGFKLCLHLLKTPKTRYFRMTSDRFFDKNANIFAKETIDIALIDGLHEHKQSLRDVQNCLKYLSKNGIIVMHDCNPQSQSAAQPIGARSPGSPGYGPGTWNGDVWKTIVYLRSHYNDLNICVLDCDHGLGVITRGKPEKNLDFDSKTLDQLEYQLLEQDRQNILNLKSTDYINTFLKNIKQQ